jgi:hypothetical protein
MLNTEAAAILDLLAAIDHRTLDVQAYTAFYLVLEPYDFNTALEATTMALRDPEIKFLIKPNDIIRYIKKIEERRDADRRRALALEAPADAGVITQPICNAHDLPIMDCLECIEKIGKLAEALGGDESPEFQKQVFSIIRSAESQK